MASSFETLLQVVEYLVVKWSSHFGTRSPVIAIKQANRLHLLGSLPNRSFIPWFAYLLETLATTLRYLLFAT